MPIYKIYDRNTDFESDVSIFIPFQMSLLYDILFNKTCLVYFLEILSFEVVQKGKLAWCAIGETLRLRLFQKP